ncbi:Up in starvation [Parahypoxylon ruwenzoriense]
MAIEVKKDDGPARSPTTPTPTKASFGQRPLPTSPFPQAVQIPESIEEKQTPKQPPKRENSQHSRKSRGGSEDMDMDDSDGETHGGDDGAGSDDESVNADGKHTGERPFQCHCSRRFSRLDNLRQHAQTVHVNEDIPIDSLAATGTRFQRQIRTDRVRQPGRARASTAGSMGTPTRGHAKSLSTSSISSVGSNFSNRDDVRRRPPPLVMADPRSRLSLETYHNSPETAYSYRPASPSDFSTPTSATFSTGQNSPRWGSTIASPSSSHARAQSMYTGHRTPGRRLSVPSGGIPFQSPHGASLGRPLFGTGPLNTSNPGAFSPTSSLVGSPTSSLFSRRESTANTEDWRRRTWHPDSHNFSAVNTSSRLSNVVTPSQFQTPAAAPLPLAAPPQQNTTLRLPGIESFGPIPHRPVSPPRRNPSPMVVDSEVSHPPALLPAAHSGDSDERRNTANWDMGLHRGLTRLDITSNNPPPADTAGTWAREANHAVEAEADRIRSNPPTVRFNEPVIMENRPQGVSNFPRAYHQHTISAPSATTSRESKRRGWYNGPVTVHADVPPEKMARVDRMVHPNINEFSGFPAREIPANPPPPKEGNPGDRDNMLRLQALVAVATSEGNATTAY